MIRDAREGSFKEIEPGEEDRVFYKLPVRKRLVVMFGGPLMNLAFALVLFTILLSLIGLPQASSTVNRVVPCLSSETGESSYYPDGTETCPTGYETTPAVEAGLQSGDTIVSVDGIPVETNWVAFTDYTKTLSAGESTVLLIRRDGVEQSLPIAIAQHTVPVYDSVTGRDTGETEQRGFIGIQPAVEYATVPVTAIPSFTWDMTVMSVKGLIGFPVKLYQLTTDTIIGGGERDVEGPVSVVGVSRIGGEVAATDQPIRDKAITFVGLLASLNLFLFLFNLLPILPLDGGHIASALAESIRRAYAKLMRKPDPGLVDTARLIPLAYVFTAALIVMSLLVIYADLVKPISISG
jgi:membrane-associated protease RseP (regulator of RpoE activity)